MNMPLEGIKVIELSTIAAAPAAARVLSDYGAEVIKVETLRGDPIRLTGGFLNLPFKEDCNPLFDLLNTGKKCISINIKTDEGKKALYELLSDADVFITNNREEALQRSGFDYETLRERFPRLVFAQFSGFGDRGPDKNAPGFDASAFWLRTGPMADWQADGLFPISPAFAFGDLATASTIVSGIMMALYAREKTGKGTRVSTSLFGSGVWCGGTSILAAQKPFNKDLKPKPLEPTHPFWHYYRCGDGVWMGIFCKEYFKDYPYYAKVFGVEDLMADPVFADAAKLTGSEELRNCVRRMNELVAAKTSEEWGKILTEADIPYEFAKPTGSVAEDEQALANGYIEKLQYPNGLSVGMPGYPLELEGFEKRRCEAGAPIGGDTDSILAGLGLTPEQIAALKESGVVK